MPLLARTFILFIKTGLSNLLKPFKDPAVALTYGRQQGNEMTKYSEHQVFTKWFPSISYENQPYPFCNNANAAVRRSVWQNIPYDENFDWFRSIYSGRKKLKL